MNEIIKSEEPAPRAWSPALDNAVWGKSFTWVLVTYLIIMLAFIAIRVVAGLGWLSSLPEAVVEIGFSVVSQIIIMAMIPLVSIHIMRKKQLIIPVTPKSTFASFGFDKPTGRVIAYGFLLGIIAYFFNIFVSSLFNGTLMLLGYRFPVGELGPWAGVGGFFVLITLVAVLPGFCEEVTHRGMLMKSFASRIGMMRAILFSSIMFGFMHLNVVQVFYAAILGYMIALATVATRSLWVGVIMHFMNNGLGIYLSFAGRYNWPLGGLMEGVFDLFGGFGIILFVVVIWGGFYAMMAIIQMFARQNYQKDKYLSLAQIISANPNILMRPDGGVYTLEEFGLNIDNAVARMHSWRRLKFYLEPETILGKRKMNLARREATLFWGLLFLGGIITVFTLVWGFL